MHPMTKKGRKDERKIAEGRCASNRTCSPPSRHLIVHLRPLIVHLNISRRLRPKAHLFTLATSPYRPSTAPYSQSQYFGVLESKKGRKDERNIADGRCASNRTCARVSRHLIVHLLSTSPYRPSTPSYSPSMEVAPQTAPAHSRLVTLSSIYSCLATLSSIYVTLSSVHLHHLTVHLIISGVLESKKGRKDERNIADGRCASDRTCSLPFRHLIVHRCHLTVHLNISGTKRTCSLSSRHLIVYLRHLTVHRNIFGAIYVTL